MADASTLSQKPSVDPAGMGQIGCALMESTFLPDQTRKLRLWQPCAMSTQIKRRESVSAGEVTFRALTNARSLISSEHSLGEGLRDRVDQDSRRGVHRRRNLQRSLERHTFMSVGEAL